VVQRLTAERDFLLLFSVGKWKSTKQKGDSSVRTDYVLRENKRNEDDDEDDGDFIGNV